CSPHPRPGTGFRHRGHGLLVRLRCRQLACESCGRAGCYSTCERSRSPAECAFGDRSRLFHHGGAEPRRRTKARVSSSPLPNIMTLVRRVLTCTSPVFSPCLCVSVLVFLQIRTPS